MILPQNIKRWFRSLLLLPAEKNASLLLWRISILRMVLLTTLILGALTMAAQSLVPLPNRPVVMMADGFALLLISLICFYKHINYQQRAFFFLIVGFCFWVWLFSEIGLPSATYLLAITVSATLLLGLLAGLVAAVLSMLALFGLGMLLFPDIVVGTSAELAPVQTWFMEVLNYGFAALLLTATSGLLINRMEAALLLSQESLRSQRQNEKLQAVGTLASGVAHDFNNVLMIIVALAESIKERSPDNNTRDGLDQILLSSERGRDIVRQLLTFSRQAVPQRKVLDLNALIHEMEPLLRAQAPAGVRCQVTYHLDKAVIVGSAAEIQQVMMNLVGNAVLAIKPKGQGSIDITLSNVAAGDARLVQLPELDASRDFVCLSVRDDGTGIKSQDLPRLFEPFFTTREPGQGTGLGLASCHGIISSLGGGISVESKPGQFSEFVVYLPLCVNVSLPSAEPDLEPVPANNLHAPAAPAAPQTSSATSVLLVDDEPMILQTSRGLLESAGFSVVAVNSAAEARQALSDCRFDLLITDYSMPVENGMSLILHARQRYPLLPVILTTGLGQLDDADPETMEAMVMLHKPYRKAELLKTIQGLLSATAPRST